MVQADVYHLGQPYLQKGQATIDHNTRSDAPWAKGLANSRHNNLIPTICLPSQPRRSSRLSSN